MIKFLDSSNIRSLPLCHLLSTTCCVILAILAGTVTGYCTDIITTVAGGGLSNDPLRMGINYPQAVAVGPDGTLYFSSMFQIFHIRGDGSLELVAGRPGGSPDNGDGGPAIDADAAIPTGMCLDGQGNLYFCDLYSIRMVTATTRIISTIAVGFSQALAVALDGSGNLCVADASTNRVYAVALGTGAVSIIAGNGTGTSSGDNGPAMAAGLSSPCSVAIDGSGNLFIVESNGYRVRRVDAISGTITTVAGNGTAGFLGDGGPAASCELYYPRSISFDTAGNLFIAQYNNIRKVDAMSGIISTVAGGGYGYSGDGGAATAATMRGPGGLAIDRSNNLFFIDGGNYRIREVVSVNQIMTTVAGNGTLEYSGDGGLATATQLGYCAHAVTDASSNLLVVDVINSRILSVASSTGLISTVVGLGSPGFSGDNGPAVSAGLTNPYRVTLDGSGNMLIVDSNDGRIRRIDASSHLITTIAGVGGGPGFAGDGALATAATFNMPQGISIAPNGDIYIADTINNRIRKISASTHIITTVAGKGASGYISHNFSGDGGPATNALLSAPADVLVDGAGNIYIADSSNNRIRFISARTGIISTVAGDGYGAIGNGVLDGGPATSGHIFNPKGLALDATGNLFIAETYRVRRVDHLTGIITTFAGNGTPGCSGDGGPADLGQLYDCFGLSFNHQGDLLIGDFGNHRIRMVIHQTTPTISWTPQALTYGSPLSIDQLNASATVPGTFTYTPAIGSMLPAGTTTLSVSFTPTDSAHSTSASTTVSLVVSPAPLQIIAEAQSRPQASANPTLTYHLAGLLNGDGAGVLNGTPTLSTTATLSSPPGSYPIVVDAAGVTVANYTISTMPAILTVTAVIPVDPVITWNPLPLIYGNGLSSDQLDATANVPGTFSYQPAAGTLLHAGSAMLSVAFTPTDSLHYNTVTVTSNLTVARAALVVAADDQTRMEGFDNAPLTYHVNGLVAGDDVSVITGTPILATTATATSKPGSYPITVDISGISATDYAITITAGTLTVAAHGGGTEQNGSSRSCGLGSAVAALIAMTLAVVVRTILLVRSRPFIDLR